MSAPELAVDGTGINSDSSFVHLTETAWDAVILLEAANYLTNRRLATTGKWWTLGATTTDIICLLPSEFLELVNSLTEVGVVKINFLMLQVESIYQARWLYPLCAMIDNQIDWMKTSRL
ncbi:hypothetical protein BX600DRAFT_516944 [Xylariales sp. PMI_506]|nr:hypothetical protein BX600DRAFT_516944 [Xylariales sp. PMI_506]